MTTTKCRQCILNCYDYLRMKENIKNDSKTFKNMLKEAFSDEAISEDVILIRDDLHLLNHDNKENCTQKTFYWVGKESLRLWSSFLLKKYEDQLPRGNQDIDEIEDNQIESLEVIKIDHPSEYLNEKSSNIDDSTKQQATLARQESSNNESNLTLNYFNEDIICSHRGLSTTQNKRLISGAVWNQFIEPYFISKDQNSDLIIESGKVFTNSSHECKICQVILLYSQC